MLITELVKAPAPARVSDLSPNYLLYCDPIGWVIKEYQMDSSRRLQMIGRCIGLFRGIIVLAEFYPTVLIMGMDLP